MVLEETKVIWSATNGLVNAEASTAKNETSPVYTVVPTPANKTGPLISKSPLTVTLLSTVNFASAVNVPSPSEVKTLLAPSLAITPAKFKFTVASPVVAPPLNPVPATTDVISPTLVV